MSSPLTHRRHLSSLDGLRGIAVTLVFLFHYYPRNRFDPISPVASSGWLGVDLFFVLSGFLITGILLDTRQQPYYFRNFYSRRALRLFPVYIVFCIVVLAVSYAFGERPTRYTLPFLLYGSNLLSGQHLNLGVGGVLQLGHLWSLALEEQFYLLWPLALYLLRTPRKIFWGCVCGIVFSATLRWMPLPWDAWNLPPYSQLPTRMDSLLSGGLLALAFRNEHAMSRITPARTQNGLACGAILLASMLSSRTLHWTGWYTLRIGYFFAALLFVAVITLTIEEGTLLHRIGGLPALRFLGRYSYGLYLWHQLPDRWVQHMLRTLEPRSHLLNVAYFAAVFLACVAWAVLSYHCIELPFLKLKNRFAYSDEKKAHRVVVDQNNTEPVNAGERTPTTGLQ